MGTAISDAVEQKTPVKGGYRPRSRKIEDLIPYVKKQITDGELARRQFLAQAWTGVSFFTGRQWVRYDTVHQRLYETPNNNGEQRRVLNYIKPAVLSTVAKLCQHQPGWLVAPATEDEADIEAARACDKLLEYEWYETKMRTKLAEIVQTACLTGVGIVRVGWDDEAGDEYVEDVTEVDETEEDESTEDVQGQGPDDSPEHESSEGETESEDKSKGKTKTKKRTGAPEVEVCSPFTTIFDPGAVNQDLSDCRWVAQIKYVPIDIVRETWTNGQYVSPDTAAAYDSYSEQMLADIKSDGTTIKQSTMDRCRITYYWERPSKRWPNGLYYVGTDTVCLDIAEELPCGQLPFAILPYDSVPGKLFGLGLVSAVKDAQEIVNEQISTRLQVLALHKAPKWTAEEGSIKAVAIDSEPGEVIIHKRGTAPPRIVPPSTISPEHERLEQAGIQHIREISGANSITQGIVEPGISGRAAMWMAELDATKLSIVSASIENMCAKIGELILHYWHEYTPVERTLKVLGQQQRLETLQFHTSMIRSFDVRVLQSSMRIRHPATRREENLLIWGAGGYGDTRNPEAVAAFRKDMEYGSLSYIHGNSDRESTYAKEENYSYLQGVESEPQPYEDHAVHIREHKNQLMSVEFRNQPREVHAALVMHLAKHESYKKKIEAGWSWSDTLLGIAAPPPTTEGAAPPPEQMPPQSDMAGAAEGTYGPRNGTPVVNQMRQPVVAQPSIRGPGVGGTDIGTDQSENG